MPIVASFAPELLELLKRAALEPLTITLNDRKKATRLCFQLNMLRKAMRLEQHPLVRLVSAVNVSTTPAGNLFARPADSAFLDAIRAAGISVSTTPLPTIVELEPVNDASNVAALSPNHLTPAQGDEEARAALRAFLSDLDLPLSSTSTQEQKP